MRDLDDRRPDALDRAQGAVPPHRQGVRRRHHRQPRRRQVDRGRRADRALSRRRRAGRRGAVDPTSPFSGGAILGDRIRMQRHALDPDVFIRSLATRGHLGGLSRSTFDVAHVLDAMGFDGS